MSASDHIQPFQMKLFVQAKDLIHMPSDEGQSSLADNADLYRQKLDESNLDWEEYDYAHGLIYNPRPGEENLRDSIAKRGVQTPVAIRLQRDDTGYSEHLTNGNHRAMAAHDIDPEMYIPVRYTDRRFSRS